jgi:hypothetical protein
VRSHTEIIRPPRALWVPFELGRPFGAPGDAGFQGRVLGAALGLLEAESGPLLADFPDDAPAAAPDDMEGWACPVNLAPPPDAHAEAGPGAALEHEIGLLAPWYDLGVEARRRTTVGISGLAPEAAGAYIVSFLGGAVPASPRSDLGPGQVLKLACDDLKAFYYEAATARPGAVSGAELETWFWEETAAAQVFKALQLLCLASDDRTMRAMGMHTLVPRSQTRAHVDTRQE